MRNKRRIVDIVILFEVLILIVAVVFSAVSAFMGSDEETIVYTARETTTQEAESEEESEEETSEEEGVPDTYEEDRLEFSDEVEELLASLTTEQLAAQLFITTPEELTGVSDVEVAGSATRSSLEDIPVAGLIYSSSNFSGQSQTRNLLSGTQEFSQDIIGLDLFLIVEEIGGSASPVADENGYTVQSSPYDLAQDGDADAVSDAASARAEYLTDEGFNMVLGPVADAASEEDSDINEFCYGTDLDLAAEYVAADITAVQAGGISSILQAFPGLGSAAEDYSVFEAAIEAGVSVIQVGSIASADVTEDDELPCCLSAGSAQMLRESYGFTGILMSADLSGEDIAALYDVGEAAVKAVQSGMNLLYVTDGLEDAYNAVLEAIESGEITETMLENAVGRILTEKLS